MTEVKRTPGPWEVRTQTYDKDIIPCDTHYVAVITKANDTSEIGHLLMVNGDYHVCKFNPTKDPFSAKKMANDAHLIAAAPELYEMLQIARDYVAAELEDEKQAYKGYESSSNIPSIKEDLERVDAALAKARGEA